MKVETYLSKFYDVNVLSTEQIDGAEKGERHIEIYEKGEDCEPIGSFVTCEGMDTFEYRNIYGKVQSGTAYTEQSLKAAARAGAFI